MDKDGFILVKRNGVGGVNNRKKKNNNGILMNDSPIVNYISLPIIIKQINNYINIILNNNNWYEQCIKLLLTTTNWNRCIVYGIGYYTYIILILYLFYTYLFILILYLF